MALEQVVGRLPIVPGEGWALIRAALSRPVIRNRHAALEALAAWGRDNEPDEKIRARIAAVLAGRQNEP